MGSISFWLSNPRSSDMTYTDHTQRNPNYDLYQMEYDLTKKLSWVLYIWFFQTSQVEDVFDVSLPGISAEILML